MARPPQCWVCYSRDIAGQVRFADYDGPGGPGRGLEPYFHRGVYYFCQRDLRRAKLLGFLSSRWAARILGPIRWAP